jgi:DNA polymerase-1
MRLVFDFEATGAQRNHAHPFDPRNKACNLGMRDIDTGETKIWKLEYDEQPYGKNLSEIQEWLSSAVVLIGFNTKYDIHWLYRYGLDYSQCRIFDCQLAWYILTAQQFQYPSLDQVAEHYGLAKKLDIVKEEYWNKGFDTDEVPYEILSEYLAQDLAVTAEVYKAIQKDIEWSSKEMQQLIKMSNLDLVVLSDIEQNGLLINLEKSLDKGNKIVTEIEQIDDYLREFAGYDWFNPNSGDHLSAFLYGGTITRVEKQDYLFTYKDGRTATKQRNTDVPYVFRGLFKPLEGSELAKEGFYATNEPTLTSLLEKAKGEYRNILETILHRAKIEKRRGTYYHGYPKRIEEMGWGGDSILHPSFNQCVTVSGRLSSTKPNVQNIEGEVKEVFITRF